MAVIERGYLDNMCSLLLCFSAFSIYLCLPGVLGLYFPQSTYYGTVEPSDEMGQGLVKLYTIFNKSDAITGQRTSAVDYDIIRVVGGKVGLDYGSVFGVNRTGWIYLNDSDAFITSEGSTVTLIIRATITGSRETSPLADVLVTFRDPADDPCAEFCFYDSLPNFHVEENSGVVELGSIGKYLRHGACRDVQFRYETSALNVSSLPLRIGQQKVFLLRSLDRESWSEAQLRVTCRVSYQNGSDEIRWQDTNILVSDVDDNPPELLNFYSGIQTGQQEWDITEDKKSLRITVSDNDIAGTSDYKIFLRDNPLNLFTVSNILILPLLVNGSWNQTTITAFIQPSKADLPPGFLNTTFEVVFRDSDFQRPARSDKPMSSEVVVTVLAKLPSVQQTEELVAHEHFDVKISANAARYARVFNCVQRLNLKKRFYFNLQKDFGVFAITLNTGIIYVNKPGDLLASFLNLTVIYFESTGKTLSRTISIGVEITARDLSTPLPCENTCAAYNTTAVCEGSCGFGSANGRCSMRNSHILGMTSDYSTCSPSLESCPDYVCDELERKDTAICPQDCTGDVTGAVLRSRNKTRARGIHFASGLCTCNTRGSCVCNPVVKPRRVTTQPPLSHPPIQRPRTATSRNNATPSAANSIVTNVSDVSKEGIDGKTCGVVCQAMISLGMLAVTAAAAICVGVWCVRRRRKRRTAQLKHVGSNVSMNAIPSDYVEERRTSHNSIEWSPKIVNNQTYDQKWEFPRQDLVLGKNLGEGEFGQVVKGKAFRLTSKEEYTLVAVKMLKNCSNESEYHDLVSEFNLLKDVNHPNVIKLLGACTREEPLYIIVEYCAHGSLRHYLRTCRHNNTLYIEANGDPNGGPVDGKPRPQLQLSTRDLLCFAWQIAKGMHYLAEMKVVHRDLAARNVLVASGKVVKISDFGLSRDVYEADAYMKKSKGRIPVKWMAPESLYDQIYTTKSDVWSYGIVLWEIVTLGATPYPGIPPERLFGLLSTGYRMDRPENCSDELYAVMQKCWKAEPQRRPFFTDLVNIFDSMLQAKMEYLDLNGAMKGPFDFEYDAREDGLISGEGHTGRGSPCPWGNSGQAYGTISMVKTDPSLYLTPTSTSEGVSSRESHSRGKTFPKQEMLWHAQHPPDKRRLKLEVDMDMDDDVFEAKETDSLRCTNV